MDYNNNNQFSADQSYSAYTGEFYNQQTPEAKKKSKVPVIIGSVAGVAAVGAGIFALANIFGGGPIKKIYNAFEKTTDKGAFAVEFKFDADSEETLEGEGIIELNKEEKFLTFDLEFNEGYDDDRVIFYDNCIAEIYGGDEDDAYYSNIADEDVEFIFDIMAEIDVMNPDKIDFEKLVSIINEYTGDSEYEIEMNEATDEIIDAYKDLVKDYYSRFNDDEWLETCLGYEKDGDTYIFEPDIAELFDDLIVFVEENEETIENLIDTVSDEYDLDLDDLDYDDLVDALEELSDVINDEISDYIDEFVIEITINGGYIESVVFTIGIDGTEVDAEILFSEFGDAEFDMDEIEDIIDEGKENVDSVFESYVVKSNAAGANANARTVYTAAATYITEYYEDPDDMEEIAPGCLYSGTIGTYDDDADEDTLMNHIAKYMEGGVGSNWAVYFDNNGYILAAWWMDEDGDVIGCYPYPNDTSNPEFTDWDHLVEDYNNYYGW